MRESRTTTQIKANDLDADIYRLAGRLETAGYVEAAQHVLKARTFVRRDMHRKDREETAAAP